MYKVSRRNEFVFAGDTLKNRKKKNRKKDLSCFEEQELLHVGFNKGRSTRNK